MKLRVLSDYPAIVVLFIWMLGPLVATIYYSLIRYNLLNPRIKGFAGIENYEFLLTDFVFTDSIYNSIQLLGSIIGITVVLGLLISYLLDQDLYGGRLLQLVIISPFFVMPTVSALIWKNLLMHPVNGYFTYLLGLFGLPPIDWFADIPLGSIIIIVSWNWLPFAVLVFITAQQSMSLEIKEASKMDGAGHLAFFLPDLPATSRQGYRGSSDDPDDFSPEYFCGNLHHNDWGSWHTDHKFGLPGLS